MAWLSAGLALLLAASTQADPGAPSPAGALSSDSTMLGTPLPVSAQDGAIDPERYVLGPGDELALSVSGRVSMSSRLLIDPEGIAWLPDLGPLRMGGLTLQDARERLAQVFARGSRGLEAHLYLTRLRRFKIYVEGEVRHPGTVEATAAMRASEAIERAGGITPEGSQRAISLRSPGDSLRSVDLLRFSRLGDRQANPTLLDGDLLLVPRRARPVYLYGSLPYEGAYEFRAGDRLSDLIRIAGGFREDAQPESARVLRFRDDRDSDALAVDLGAVLRGTDDLALQEGDRVFVPSRGDYHQDRHVTVTGEVVRPGVYSLAEGSEHVSDLIHRAGGLSGNAAPNGIVVVRAGSATLERDPEFARLSRLSRNEMTDAEYQMFRAKLAAAQNAYRVDREAIFGAPASHGGAKEAGAYRARDVLLQSGDMLFVDRLPLSVRLAGEVRQPGLVAFEPGRGGEEYIRLAGGFTAKAKRGGVRITRYASGQTLPLRDARQVEPGDLIFVPDRPDVRWLSVIRDVVTFSAAVATLVIALRR